MKMRIENHRVKITSVKARIDDFVTKHTMQNTVNAFTKLNDRLQSLEIHLVGLREQLSKDTIEKEAAVEKFLLDENTDADSLLKVW